MKNGQSKETGNIWSTRLRQTKQEHNTICVGHHYTQTIIDYANKTWTILQATGSSIWARTKSYLRRSDEEQPEVMWPEVTSVTWPELTLVTCPVQKCILRMCNQKLRNIRLSVAFWPEVTKSRDRKRPCPEALLTGSRFCACPVSPPAFFLSSINMATGCDLRSLDPFGVPLGVRIRSRKLRNTCSDQRSRDSLEESMGCSLRRPRPITIGNPASYI